MPGLPIPTPAARAGRTPPSCDIVHTSPEARDDDSDSDSDSLALEDKFGVVTVMHGQIDGVG
jgi:hypothetical protein